MTDSAPLKITPLHARHRALGALMAPFGGWEMPIQYEGIIAEHRWCREQAALFDICHMGEFLFCGDIVADGLEQVFSFSVAAIPVGRSKYGFLLNDEGGIIDDLIVFRLAEDRAMIVVNAATAPNDYRVIAERLQGGELRDISATTAKLDLQGPRAREVLSALVGEGLAGLPYFRFAPCQLVGEPGIVSRTGYTGELGYELFLPAAAADRLWDLLADDPRVKPAGLGARDLLRLEMGYSLYGNDLDEWVTPLEADLAAFVDLSKPFTGREALLQQRAAGLGRIRVAFAVDSRRTPRHGYTIQVDGIDVGQVTSGVFSPMRGCGIGLGFVTPQYAAIGQQLVIVHERTALTATVCALPFYGGGSLRS